MKKRHSSVPITSAAAALAAMTWGNAASAGGGSPGTIIFAPASTAAVPALGGAMLLLLAALLAVVGLRAARQRRAVPLVGALTAGTLMASGALPLISPSNAGFPSRAISNPDGQQFGFSCGTTRFDNESAVPMETVALTINRLNATLSTPGNPGVEQCVEGLVLAADDSCDVRLVCEDPF